jgi:hypothetical protein
MIWTRVSLYYLASYLVIIGVALVLAPSTTLTILQSNGDYGDVFPRFGGMMMSGLGFSVFGIIAARSEQQYPTTLVVRTYFLVCLVAFYAMTSDPFFLVLVAIVVIGFVLTVGSYLIDRLALQSP